MCPIKLELIKQIVSDQAEEPTLPQYIGRTAEEKSVVFSQNKEIIVMTGIRRSGKSVLLQQIRQNNAEKNYYFNFEDERLIDFSVADFHLLQEAFVELFGTEKTYYFDEIQNIPGWELFVRRLYNSGNKIYITGSNALLFNAELSTRLTGRYIPIHIYPLSFYEILKYQAPQLVKQKTLSTASLGKVKRYFSDYYRLGGFPEYFKYQQNEYLQSLFEGIVFRDIIVRNKITNSKPFRELVFYLATNCSKEITYSGLRKLLKLGSTTTISDYCSYLEDSYLCYFINRYHPSVKTQLQSPKKVYFVDHMLAKVAGFRFSDDIGRMLENIVFIELKRRNFEIYYHREKKECDFLVREGIRVVQAIQVCKSFSEPYTREREIEGLLEALELYSLKEGLILTESEEDTLSIQRKSKYKIHIMPIWKWLTYYYIK